MTRRLAKLALMGVLCAGASLPAAAQQPGVTDTEIVIGDIVPLTGPPALLGVPHTIGVRLAVAEVNAAGGIHGRKIRMISEDDGYVPSRTVQGVRKLINSDKVDLILGPAPSGVASKLAESFGTDKVPACSGSTTAANLQGAGNGYFFRTAPGDNLQGPALATLILGDNHKKVSIIARNDDYGKGFSESLQAGLEESGAEVTGVVLYNPDSGSGYDADVEKALEGSPDAVAVLGFNDDGAQIITAMIGKGTVATKKETARALNSHALPTMPRNKWA